MSEVILLFIFFNSLFNSENKIINLTMEVVKNYLKNKHIQNHLDHNLFISVNFPNNTVIANVPCWQNSG